MIFMCSTYVPFEIKPEKLAAKGREYGMFWCISCNGKAMCGVKVFVFFYELV